MQRRKLKPYVIPVCITLLALASILTIKVTSSKLSDKKPDVPTYVTDRIIEDEVPVMNEEGKIINPYTDASVTIGKNYYDYKSAAPEQEKSIVYHDNTYMQNSGIDFKGENVFDVVSIMNGTVTNVKDDEILGKTIEIKHENDYISFYQSLSEVSVKKGDVVTQGQVIGKSGTNELDKDIGNHLHFEMYINGQIVNPILYLNKEINKKAE